MRDLRTDEQQALEVMRRELGEVECLHTGETGANLKHSNMDSVTALTDFFSRHGIHDYRSQSVGPEHKVVVECVIYDGRTTELSPMSFNKARSRSRPRFWIPALRRMAVADDVLAFAEDGGLPIVINLTGVTRSDPGLRSLIALLGSKGSSSAVAASAATPAVADTLAEVGFEASAEERRAMEAHSRQVASDYLESQGWSVKPTVGSIPYDLVASKNDKTLYVEVKSSKGPADVVIVTSREVEFALEAPEAALFIVSGVQVGSQAGKVTASGGDARIVMPWKPSAKDLTPISYRYIVPPAHSIG